MSQSFNIHHWNRFLTNIVNKGYTFANGKERYQKCVFMFDLKS